MALMCVYEHGDNVLTYDTDDVESYEVHTQGDVLDVTRPEDAGIRRELGQAHLQLTVHFKPGKRALWIEKRELNHG